VRRSVTCRADGRSLQRFFALHTRSRSRISSWIQATLSEYADAIEARHSACCMQATALIAAALFDSIRPVVVARAKDPTPSVLAMLPRLHDSLFRCWRQAELASSVERITRTQTLESLLLLWRNYDSVVVRHLGASLEDSFNGLLSFRVPTHSPRWVNAVEARRRAGAAS